MQLLPARSEDGAASFFPFLTWARTVNRQTLGADLMAGLTGAVIMIPQGVAFATSYQDQLLAQGVPIGQ